MSLSGLTFRNVLLALLVSVIGLSVFAVKPVVLGSTINQVHVLASSTIATNSTSMTFSSTAANTQTSGSTASTTVVGTTTMTTSPGQTSLNTTQPQLTLIPNNGQIYTNVQIEGGYFSSSDTTCSISSPSSAIFLENAACWVSFPKNVTGSFRVGNVTPGQYVIQVSGSPQGDFAQGVFSVTPRPAINLSPTSGEVGAYVSVSGSSFPPEDDLCSISRLGNSAVLGGTPLCSINTGTGVLSGSFTVGNVLPGEYTIQVTSSGSCCDVDFAQGTFNVRGPVSTTTSSATSTSTASTIMTTTIVSSTSSTSSPTLASVTATSTTSPIVTSSTSTSSLFGTVTVTVSGYTTLSTTAWNTIVISTTATNLSTMTATVPATMTQFTSSTITVTATRSSTATVTTAKRHSGRFFLNIWIFKDV